MKIGSMFSGYGGLDLAVEATFPGTSPAWFCEWDKGPAAILAHHWPEVPNLRDVTAIDWAGIEPVDILTGGYPCQPFSAAGHRKGTDDVRHLWPYVREAVRVLRPRLVVLENVAGHRSLGFDRVLGDMAEDGLDVWWTSVRASDIGAPHHRDRLFIVAAPADAPSLGLEAGRLAFGPGPALAGDHDGAGTLADAERRQQLPTDAALDPVYGPVIRRWEALTRPAPPPVDSRDVPILRGTDWAALGFEHMDSPGAPTHFFWERASLSPAFVEWMMGLPAGHVTAAGVSRSAQLKALGNGVCPQQACEALRQILPHVLERTPA